MLTKEQLDAISDWDYLHNACMTSDCWPDVRGNQIEFGWDGRVLYMANTLSQARAFIDAFRNTHGTDDDLKRAVDVAEGQS